MTLRSFFQRGFLRLLLAMGLGALLLGAVWACLPSESVPAPRLVEAALDPVAGSHHILPRLSAIRPMTWMTPEEEALWAAVGGLEAAYLMNPHPYTNSAEEDETVLEDWMEAALAEEAAAAVSDDTTPGEEVGPSTLPLVPPVLRHCTERSSTVPKDKGQRAQDKPSPYPHFA